MAFESREEGNSSYDTFDSEDPQRPLPVPIFLKESEPDVESKSKGPNYARIVGAAVSYMLLGAALMALTSGYFSDGFPISNSKSYGIEDETRHIVLQHPNAFSGLGNLHDSQWQPEIGNLEEELQANLGPQGPAARPLASRTRTLEDSDLTDDAKADQIVNLPGLTEPEGGLPFRQFSGHLAISDSKNIFYWFTESENDPASDPVVFWTNGGPGCSGLIGFLGEQGPFRVKSGGSELEMNDYAWNKVSNTVYIEQPCGVGFSYSTGDISEDYSADDDSASQDNLQVILKFLEKFPNLKDNQVFLTAESYGGHYLPTWAHVIVDYNTEQAKNGDETINFGGFAVGNPYTDPKENALGMFGTFYGHQLVPRPLWTEYEKGCLPLYDISYSNLLDDDSGDVQQCMAMEGQMMEFVGGLDPYALDYATCLSPNAELAKAGVGRGQRAQLLQSVMEGRMAPYVQRYYQKSMRSELREIDSSSEEERLMLAYDQCENTWMTEYLNQPEVKAALHVPDDIEWEECSYQLNYDRSDMADPMEPHYKYLIDSDADIRIWVYSGDDDSVCGTMGTQMWVYDLGYEITRPWQEWKVNGQVAGFEVLFDGLSFVTVHDAGHEVPAFKPEESLALFKAFLAGESLADSSTWGMPMPDN
eukprot:CAMPEP_0113943222 /NCGR_PEP_ID=MMETSP1339-20121228/21113_1 /TAXON_ID=94617 /ORGANISM="Fibrocapsa japonica" /LENGTH=644 /DNA_ID=CAMNT_0000948035 /DNA_START=89 /DNA_END=2023 /DNA_ORIENTATION=+ /assembly_acc=CAM_ASM_000762